MSKKQSKALGQVKSWLKTAWDKFQAGRRRVKGWHWWQRWPFYILVFILLFLIGNRIVDRMVPPIKDPQYGVSFSVKYSKELGNDWKANYIALMDDLGFKRLRLMSYWDSIEPQKGKYDFKDLDWQFDQANKRGAKVSLSIGFRQPRWPECHEPEWAKKITPETEAWRSVLYKYIVVVMKRYKNNPALESYQLENEAKNNWFGGCHGAAPDDRLTAEFNLAKKTDPNHPVWMNLSDEHGLPLRGPNADAYGYSIYRIVYSNNTPIHFYINYPVSDWYHRLRTVLIHRIKHRPVYIHELQLEPWGPKTTRDLSIKEQDRSMSLKQIHTNLMFGRKAGIKLQYMWGGEWWYWRLTKFHDPGPWNIIKKTLQQFPTPIEPKAKCGDSYSMNFNPEKIPNFICE